MNKFLILSVVIAVSMILGSKAYATTRTQWNNPEWGACVSTGSQCGTDNGTQERTLTCIAGGEGNVCSLGTWVETTYIYANPICPNNYHLQNSGNWNQLCHRNNNNIHPEHKSPTGCPSGYSQNELTCRKVDVAGHFINPETSVVSQSCNTGEIDYSACTAEEQCPTACGLSSSEVADGKGGLKQCEATVACVVDVCENLDGVQESTPEGYVNNEGVCTVKEEPKEEPKPIEKSKKNVFHSLKGCYGPTPDKPQWAIKVPAQGGITAKWSAMGGEKVQIEVTNSKGEYEYKYSGVNDGKMYLPNVAMSQIYRIRVLRGCKESEWLVDR